MLSGYVYLFLIKLKVKHTQSVQPTERLISDDWQIGDNHRAQGPDDHVSVSLSSPGGSNSELGLSTSGDGQQELALVAGADVLNMRENGVDSLALGALDVHEEGVWALYKSLELVAVLFLDGVDVKKINFHICF